MGFCKTWKWSPARASRQLPALSLNRFAGQAMVSTNYFGFHPDKRKSLFRARPPAIPRTVGRDPDRGKFRVRSNCRSVRQVPRAPECLAVKHRCLGAGYSATTRLADPAKNSQSVCCSSINRFCHVTG